MIRKFFILLLLTIIAVFHTSCAESCENKKDESKYAPVIMKRTDFENSVKLIGNQTISKHGKIYIKHNTLLVNDLNKGFQIYDYSDSQNPIPISYLNIPGSTDISIRNNTLYINQAVDLVTLLYNNIDNTISITNRNRNVFPKLQSPDGFSATISDDEVIIYWKLKP
jgi:hypothetical protein